MNETPIFASANSVVRIDTLSVLYTRKDRGFFVLLVRWNYQGYRLADHFFRGIAVKSLCTFVPRRYDTVEAETYDSIITGFHNRSDLPEPFLALAERSFDLTSFNQVGCLSGQHI